MDSNNTNEQELLEHLSEMFAGISLENLRNICDMNQWSLDSCIDAIIDNQNNHNPCIKLESNNINLKKVNHNMKNVTVMSDIKELVEHIQCGHRVLILMRGPPGSGKSYLASEIIRQSFPSNKDLDHQDFVHSADNFFYDASGLYRFRPDKLDKAHAFNQDRVRKKALEGWSPLIVDNTNIHIWQMLPYVKIAVENGYLLKIIEPKTPWRFSASKLAGRNKHNVPKETIQRMLDNFDKTDVDDLLQIINTKYTIPIPQMRMFPPIAESSSNVQNQCTVTDNAPELPIGHKDATNSKIYNSCSSSQTWKPFEEESRAYWFQNTKLDDCTVQNSNSNKNLLDLLKENITSEETTTKLNLDEESANSRYPNLECHSVDCPNENKSFFMLRQIYPTTEPSNLWDLFVKCQGDIDWVVDILIKEGDGLSDNGMSCLLRSGTSLQCSCGSEGVISNVRNDIVVKTNTSNTQVKPQRERIRISKVYQNKIQNAKLITMKENIEKIFVFPQKNPQETDRKLRISSGKCSMDKQTQTTFEEDTDDFPPDELLEITFGETFVNQLNSIFKDEISLFEKLSNDLNTNVFIPRSLAKQLYMLWIESAYNQMEERQQEILRQDEGFARLLKNPGYEDCKETPENFQDILNDHLGWSENDFSKEEKEQNNSNYRLPTDLATHLSTMKLCEIFPNIPRDTLVDVLAAHGNDFTKTVDLLRKSNEYTDLDVQAFLNKNQVPRYSMPEKTTDKANNIKQSKSEYSSDDLKHLALREFEETRNIAAHHCQLRAECFEKAKEAFQKGNGGIAAYYSEIASLHKHKIEIYNQKAANCIVEVHRHTQCNPDLLDLHYLHVAEAVECLDIFLDQHITGLRMSPRVYKHVFLITGRGLHSIGGVSSIKKKVKTRLKERHLRWIEVNPGLLKVKLYSSSRHTTNC